MKNVVFLSVKKEVPADSYWDQRLLKDLLQGLQVSYSTDGLDEAIVIIPGAYQFDVVDKINKELNKLKKCVVIVTSDEENKFPLGELKHRNMRLYATYAYETDTKVRWLPIGYPDHIEEVSKDVFEKDIDLFFSGQVNHESRSEMIDAVEEVENKYINVTGGFSQGLEHREYFELMSRSKVVLAPRGNISPDSFRLYEALECGAVPIAENNEFWERVFGSVPFPVIQKSEQWSGYAQDAIDQYPYINNRCQAWWIQQKNRIRKELVGQHFNVISDGITVIVPVSPIKSHPETSVLEETIKSIRYHLPTSDILITFDGVRAEQEEMRDAYEEHIRRVLWKAREWNITPYIFDEHMHQSGMARFVLEKIDTPLVLYVEQDTPLVTDESIDWDHLVNKIIKGDANVIRFHFEAFIPEPHKHLMLGEPEDQLLKTAQWSQRPHLASTPFYRRILADHFSANTRCFIEDLIHGRLYEDFVKDGFLGWNQWRVYIYHPNNTNIKRSYHTDGRAGGAKYDDTQIW